MSDIESMVDTMVRDMYSNGNYYEDEEDHDYQWHPMQEELEPFQAPLPEEDDGYDEII